MCGLAGMVHVDPDYPVDRGALEAMGRALEHRGPDDSGIWLGGGAGLAHRRLSIIDLSPAGRQPMSNEEETVRVVVNGEIYNFLELREELSSRGHRFRSRSDSEVVVHLYEELGPACVKRLEGMFALAVWDAPRRRLLLARDRLGKKPLKYASTADGLLFASELKALLASGSVEREVELDDIHAFLSLGYVPSPGTGFRAIRKLPPAHLLVWENGVERLERYWDLDFRGKESLELSEWKTRVRGTVQRAVERRLISDVPLGVFLSGGVDSSLVAACMARASSAPVATFSVGFDFDRYDELPYARLIADRYRTDHHELTVRADAAALLPRLARTYEEPYCDPSALPSFLLARETRRHVKVVLNGDGGDEGFAGYTRYSRLADWAGRLSSASRLGLHRLAKPLDAVLRGRLPALARRLEAVSNLVDPDDGVRYAWMMRLFSEGEKSDLYEPRRSAEMNGSGCAAIARLAADARAGSSLVDRMLFVDTMSYLPDDLLVKMDLATMAHGLEARSPLLDREVIEVAASAPAELKYRGGRLKWLLKEAFREDLPPEIVDREKMGFGIPLDEWLRGPLLPTARDLLLSRETRILRYFRPRALGKLVERHAAGAAANGRRLWGLLMLELWHREVLERPAGSV